VRVADTRQCLIRRVVCLEKEREEREVRAHGDPCPTHVKRCAALFKTFAKSLFWDFVSLISSVEYNKKHKIPETGSWSENIEHKFIYVALDFVFSTARRIVKSAFLL
jgi:hypothetical protein